MTFHYGQPAPTCHWSMHTCMQYGCQLPLRARLLLAATHVYVHVLSCHVPDPAHAHMWPPVWSRAHELCISTPNLTGQVIMKWLGRSTQHTYCAINLSRIVLRFVSMQPPPTGAWGFELVQSRVYDTLGTMNPRENKNRSWHAASPDVMINETQKSYNNHIKSSSTAL